MKKIQAKREKSLKGNEGHKSVMVSEVLEAFGLSKGAHSNKNIRLIDATLGLGGHAEAMLDLGANVLGIDADDAMLEIARERLDERTKIKIIQGNFKDIKAIAEEENFVGVNGILFDLGVSNLQLTSETRGFSFSNPKAALDMRLNASYGPTAADLLNALRQDQLEDLFSRVLTKNESKKMALGVGEYKKNKPVKTVGDFLEICLQALSKNQKIHPATRPFLALRMAVNSELENLKEALPDAFSLLKSKGRIAVISFHSGEDALVKDFFRTKEKEGKAFVITEKPIVPSNQEILENPKSRSAKLRILEKI